MTLMGFVDAATTYVSEPSSETWAPLRGFILAASTYDPLIDFSRWQQPRDVENLAVLAEISALMPGAFLNPTAHRLLARAYEADGDMASAARERTLADLGIATILRSGTGERRSPWEVLRVADEYDALGAIGCQPIRQVLRHTDGRDSDEFTFDDGSHVWFMLP